jgi:hypothetical protein
MNKQDEQLEALKGKAAEDLAKPKKIELRAGTPTYPALHSVPVEEARKEFDRVFDNFLVVTEEWNEQAEQDDEDDDEQEDDEQEDDEQEDDEQEADEDDDPFLDYAEDAEDRIEALSPVHAACITTGGGKMACTRFG